MNKSVPTQFRLSPLERKFISKQGKGNIFRGLRELMKMAGFKVKFRALKCPTCKQEIP